MTGAKRMSDVSVLGLGLMGSALARALLRAGLGVTVWNRSAGRATPLQETGALVARDVASAVAAAPVVLICVDSYEATRSIMDATGVAEVLPGRIIVQLSTGTPREAREGEAWFEARGAHYLDGAILAGTRHIDDGKGILFYAGKPGVFGRCRTLLAAMGAEARYAGEDAGAASALDFAWLSQTAGTFIGLVHGAAVCESEGVDLALFAGIYPDGHDAHYIVDTIRNGSFGNRGATLAVWNAAIRRILEQAADAGMDGTVPACINGIMNRAEEAGHGDEHVAAMVKVLRGQSRH